jgi:hypothetical protein
MGSCTSSPSDNNAVRCATPAEPGAEDYPSMIHTHAIMGGSSQSVEDLPAFAFSDTDRATDASTGAQLLCFVRYLMVL